MRLGRLRSTPSRPLILLSPYKFGATKSLYSFRAPGTRAVKRDITGAISRPGNTLAVWPDRVTILTIRDIRLKHHRLVNQSSLSATARKPPRSRLLHPFIPRVVSRLIELKQVIASFARLSFSKTLLSLSLDPSGDIERSYRVFPHFKDNGRKLIEVEVARYGVIRYQHRYRR